MVKVKDMTARDVLDKVDKMENYIPSNTIEQAHEQAIDRLENGYKLMKEFIARLHPGTRTLL